MRNKERQIPEAEALSILEKGEYGVLSMVTAQNEPYSVPVNYCMVDSDIYFHCAVAGFKLDCLLENPSVNFCVVGETRIHPDKFTTKYESCLVSGSAAEVFDNEKEAALKALIKKYSAGYESEGDEYIQKAGHKTKVIKIVPQSITGKASR